MRWFCERTMIQRGQKTHAFITAFGRSFYTPLYMYHLTYRHCLVLDWSFLSHIPYMSVIFLIYFLVSCLSILNWGGTCNAAATFVRFCLPQAPRPGLPVLWVEAHRPPFPPAPAPGLVGKTRQPSIRVKYCLFTVANFDPKSWFIWCFFRAYLSIANSI